MGTILGRNLKSMDFLMHKVTRHQRPAFRSFNRPLRSRCEVREESNSRCQGIYFS